MKIDLKPLTVKVESPDEFKQRLIVRQSCLNRAIEVVSLLNKDTAMDVQDCTGLVNSVKKLAEEFEEWVMRK